MGAVARGGQATSERRGVRSDALAVGGLQSPALLGPHFLRYATAGTSHQSSLFPSKSLSRWQCDRFLSKELGFGRLRH